MNSKNVYLYVCDTMSDWEIGYIIAELNSGRYFKKDVAPIKVVTVGVDKNPVTTMGGLKVMPDMSVEECVFKRNDVVILPGGQTWMDDIHEPILRKSAQSLEEGSVVAAICGATMGMAKMGVLDTRAHTSNNLDYMKMICPHYNGEKHYQNKPAVTDENLITATGLAPLEFAMHVLKVMDVCDSDTLHAWFNLYKTYDSKYFFELMNAIK